MTHALGFRQRAKATLPWAPEQQTSVKHVTRYEKSREEREYDLVLGKFRDAERELDRKGQDQHNVTSGLERGRVRLTTQFAFAASLDLIIS